MRDSCSNCWGVGSWAMTQWTVFYCGDCNGQCEAVEETFDYGGTHCTHGKGGTHHTGNYVSDCCGAELLDNPKEEEEPTP